MRACVPVGAPWLDVLGCILVHVCVRMVLFNPTVLCICPWPRMFAPVLMYCFPRSGNNTFTDVVVHFVCLCANFVCQGTKFICGFLYEK